MASVASRADTGAAWGAGEAGSGSGAMGSDGPSAWLSGGASDSAEAPRGTVIGPKDTGRLGRVPPADRIRSVRGPEATPRKRKNPGDDLFSRKAALSVSSALESLTSVFGMGTGMASPLESPGFVASGRGRQRHAA